MKAWAPFVPSKRSPYFVVDVPPIEPEVTEYIQYIYRYKDCGQLIYQPLPDEVKRKHFGPGILALVAIITGMLNTSKRKALAMMGAEKGCTNGYAKY